MRKKTDAVALFHNLTNNESQNDQKPEETFAKPLNEIIASLVKPIVREIGKQPATMSKEEKLRLMEAL